MTETDATFHPLAGEVVQSAPMSQHLDEVYDYNDRWLDGLNQSSIGLNLTLTAGHVAINGRYISFDSPVVKSLTANSTNHVFADENADIIVNTTGVVPSNSIKLWELTTNSTVVTGTPIDSRSRDIQVSTKFTAEGLSANNQRVTNVADPTNNTDGVNLQHLNVQLAASGLLKFVKAIMTSPGTLATDYENGDTAEGATLSTGDIILLAAQTPASDNGPRVVQSSGAPIRATYFNSSAEAEAAKGMLFSAQAGNNAKSVYKHTTTATITLDTTALVFEEVGVAAIRGTSNGLATLTSGVHTTGERPFATAATRGDSRLSTAPASATDPIAVGTNDARVTADQAAATASIRTLGTGATQATAGNDARLSDTRTPTDGTVSTPKLVDDSVTNPKLADMAANTVKANATASATNPADLAIGVNSVLGRVAGNIVAAPIVAAQVTSGTLTDTQIAAANKDGTAGTPSLRTLGTTATQACAGSDSRLSDTRTPTDNTVSTVKIVNDAVDNTKMADMVQATVKGRASGAGTGDPTDLSQAQVRTIIGAGSGNGLDADLFEGQHGSFYQDRANHTGTQLASTISDFNTAVKAAVSGAQTWGGTHPNSQSEQFWFPIGGAQGGRLYVPRAGVIRNLRCSGTVTSVGQSIVVNPRINGVNSTLTATIPQSTAANTVVSDLANAPSVAAGDYVEVRVSPSSSFNHSTQWSFEFIPN